MTGMEEVSPAVSSLGEFICVTRPLRSLTLL